MFAEVGYPTEEIQDELNGIDGIDTEEYEVHIAVPDSIPVMTYCGIQCEKSDEIPWAEANNMFCPECLKVEAYRYKS